MPHEVRHSVLRYIAGVYRPAQVRPEFRIHKTLRMTPAMAAGGTDRLWEIADIAKLMEDAEAKPAKRGPYKMREQ
jgi:hypothetical protein